MKFFWFLAIAGLLAISCRQEPDSKKLLDELVVSTNYDTEANFSAYSTYSIPTDTVGFVSNVPGDDTIIVAKESTFPRPILDAVRTNLESRGYTRVNKTANPDLGVNVLVVNDFNVFQQVVYPNYWGPGGYYSGYYGYSSYYYYPYVSTYAYNTGLLVIEIVDLKNKTPDNKVRVIWTAYLGDVYSTIDRIPQCLTAINQAFQQSQYVTKNGL